ncbi:MAG: sigma 54-interacting transcriptional regulator [Clostridia bacterium]|nr:sigma 54-interacting transcriptional regulator [Clostridia bacterium]
MVRLLDIKTLVQKIAEAITSVLDMDVIISDDQFNKIADTKRHFNLEVTQIKDTYVLGKVIHQGHIIVVEGKDDEEQCRLCVEKENCNLQAMICIPIHLEDKVIGAIALIAIDETSRQRLLLNQKNLIEYMNRMAELIVGKVLEQEVSNRLEIIKNQMVHITNAIDEGVITLNEYGEVLYVNKVITDFFGLDEDALKAKMITEFLNRPYIKKLLEDHTPFSNNETVININQRELNGLISGKPMDIGSKSIGFILTFRNMKDIYSVVNKVSLNNYEISFETIIGKSKKIKTVKETARKVADSNSTVLILGESGTGKELFARAIHFSSNRKEAPFIALNCAAIPETLLESELFGYEEGSFTGAMKGGKLGKFQLANGGTIFLDEIGDMPLHLQTKLLRVLQEKSVEKIGGVKSVALDVRVIAATNKNLESMVEANEFREDLYYRLSVIPLYIPALRERTGDIKILLDYFLLQYNAKLHKQIEGFSQEVENMLLKYSWPGNIRELENVVEYAVNLEPSLYVTMAHIPQKVKGHLAAVQKDGTIMSISDMEKKMIVEALALYGSSYEGKKQVSKVLGIGTATLYRKIEKYGIG